jgi:hypothetical protein
MEPGMVGLRVTDQGGLIGHADIHGDLPVGAADGRKIGMIAEMSTLVPGVAANSTPASLVTWTHPHLIKFQVR